MRRGWRRCWPQKGRSRRSRRATPRHACSAAAWLQHRVAPRGRFARGSCVARAALRGRRDTFRRPRR
jgi:hypothetical protein